MGEEEIAMFPDPELKTDRLGGVDVPSAEVLAKMHQGDYILRAHDGVLDEIPVDKILLPHEDNTSPQSVDVKMTPDGFVPALKQAIEVTKTGQPALLDCIYKENYDFSKYP